MHHVASGGRHPAAPGSRCEFDLTAQFRAIFTGCGIHCAATPRKIAAGVGSRLAAAATAITSKGRIP